MLAFTMKGVAMKIMEMILIAILAAAAAGCEDDACRPRSSGPPPIGVLRVEMIDGLLYANLMPIVPPDPISCTLTLSVENTSEKYSYSGITIADGDVYLGSNNEKMGEFRFMTFWDGALRPGETDTFEVFKVMENHTIFIPPCGDALYIDLSISADGSGETMRRTPNVFCTCAF
jgi:hypothetical protein